MHQDEGEHVKTAVRRLFCDRYALGLVLGTYVYEVWR